MDLQFVGVVLSIVHSVSAIAWTGSIVFFLIVIIPVISQFSGDTRVSANTKLYRLSRSYLRTWGLLTVFLGIIINVLPIGTPQAILHRFDPLNVMFVEVLTILAYFVIGEGYIFRSMGMYSALSGTLDEKARNRPVAHLTVLEKKVSNMLTVQLILLVIVVAASIYFPVAYSIP